MSNRLAKACHTQLPGQATPERPDSDHLGISR